MNIIFVIIVVCILFPWLPGLLFYIWFFSIACYSILSNFYTPLINLILISLLLRLRDFALKYPLKSEFKKGLWFCFYPFLKKVLMIF